jgi:hypothetical protein
MADYLVYWQVFWRENPTGVYIPDFDFGTNQDFWGNVAIGDSVWCVTFGGDQAPDEWRLIQRIVVQEKYIDADSDWSNRFRGDPAQSEAYQVTNQADLTPLLHQLEFKSGRRITVSGREIGNAIQSARPLTEADQLLFEKFTGGLLLVPPSETVLNRAIGVSDDDFSPRTSATGAGFGNPETNRKVERAAVSAVTKRYESEGWLVESVEAKKCGYDLVCLKDGYGEKHVEVKGVQGGLVAFIITVAEARRAENNADFVLCVVTSALTDDPTLHFYDPTTFASHLDLAPLAYRATLRKT